MDDFKKLPGLKQHELTKCMMCDKGVAHGGNIDFYRITMEQFIFDSKAIQRQVGLEMMLGGHATLAHAMGPNEDLAKNTSRTSGLLCQPCAIKSTGALQLWDAGKSANLLPGEE